MTILVVRRGLQGNRGETGLAAPATITVANNIANVNAVAASIANVDAIMDNITNIDTVADNIADVIATGTDIASVNSAAANMAAIIAAPGYATTTTANKVACELAQAAAEAAAAGMKYRNVRAGTTANITLSGTQTVDGVALAVGNRVLVKNQSTTANNGIYVVASGAWTRASDMDTWLEVPGIVAVVTEGTVNGDTVWLCTANDGGTLGSTAITFIDWGAIVVNGSLSLSKLAPIAANTALMNATGSSASVAAVALAANQFFGRGSSGDIAAKAISDDALTFVAAANFAAMRTTLGTYVGPQPMPKRSPTSGTSDTQTGIPAGVKRVTVNFQTLAVTGAGDNWALKIGPSGGVESSGYRGMAFRSGVSPAFASTLIPTGAPQSAASLDGSLTFNLLDAATNTWAWSGNLGYAGANVILMSGSKSLAGPLERILIGSDGGSPGTLSSGSWNVTYE